MATKQDLKEVQDALTLSRVTQSGDNHHTLERQPKADTGGITEGLHQGAGKMSLAANKGMEERLQGAIAAVRGRISAHSEALLPMRAQRLWECMLKQDDSLEVSLDLNAFFAALASTGVVQLQLVSQSDREDESEKELYITGFQGVNTQGILECNICCDQRADVRLSPCRHSVCRTCLLKMRQQLVYSPHSDVNCPFCRTVVKEYYDLQELREYEQTKVFLLDNPQPVQQAQPAKAAQGVGGGLGGGASDSSHKNGSQDAKEVKDAKATDSGVVDQDAPSAKNEAKPGHDRRHSHGRGNKRKGGGRGAGKAHPSQHSSAS